MKAVKCIFCTALILTAVTGAVFASAGAEGVEKIRKAGVLKVGVKSDVPKFGLLNTSTNRYEGMEIELAGLIAKEILGDASKTAFTPVTAKTRGPLLDNGDIDLVIATFTITEDRKLSYNFSTSYYTDAVGLLVKKSSGFTGLKDMDGKTIGVAQSATSRAAIQQAANDFGITVNFMEFATYPEIKAALDSGRVDVFSVDKSILNGYLDNECVILPDAFSPQEYGVTSKLSNKELSAYVEGLIKKWLADGTIAGLIKKYDL
ncbi:MAG: transporter substrate-binding domain-containing protein [Treponema sp.]|jgi:putative glutamine transport system substrate-binding protein|nr:transporter substrate-binding domain-containing protein [Treponema sp.]